MTEGGGMLRMGAAVNLEVFPDCFASLAMTKRVVITSKLALHILLPRKGLTASNKLKYTLL